MRKFYPYLQDSYYENVNDGIVRRKFLASLDEYVNQKQYVKITLLNWMEEPLKEISGEITTGNLTKDGSSAIRRTCSLTASVNASEYSVEDMEGNFAINKKIFLEIGIKNYTNSYPEYPILWFPQGVFFISDFSINAGATASTNISLSLKDKMFGLNGDVGGKFSSTTILDELDSQAPSGEYISEKVKIYQLIQELVHHFGGEDLNNIVIEDVPLRIKRVMRWMGDNPLWMVPQQGDVDAGYGNNLWYDILVDEPEDKPAGTLQINTGEDAGYIYDDFVYTGELVASPGESVCTVLDKIKQYLGNYEYFYDEFGVFHFREIKNYLNTTQGKILLDEMDKNDYLVEISSGKSVYTFSDNRNLITLNATPQYSNIKNDYVIQGLRKMTGSDISYPIRYHLAIDRKPLPGNTYRDLLIYKEESTGTKKAVFPVSKDSEKDLPQPGDFNLVYRVGKQFFYWEDSVYKEIKPIQYYPINEAEPGYITKDWRTELYLQGLLAKNKGTDAGYYYSQLEAGKNMPNTNTTWLGYLFRNNMKNRIDTDYYFEELEAFWPLVYDLETQKFIGEDAEKPLRRSALADGRFYLDFIDPSVSTLGEYAISNIGRRTDVVNNNEINCLFEPEIPNIVFINNDDDNKDKLIEECQLSGEPFTKVRGEIYWGFATGGYNNAAFDQLKYEMYVHTNYQKTLSLTALPVFYLEPNSRIEINDKTTNTYGAFMIQNITIPLGSGGVMSASCNECLQKT